MTPKVSLFPRELRHTGALKLLPVVILLAVAVRLGVLQTSHVTAPGVWVWKRLSFDLPPSIKVFEGNARGEDNQPFKAWRVEIDYADRKLQMKPFLSTAPSGREPASAQAKRAGAYVAVNGGYFDMDLNPAKTYSLVLQDGKTLVENIAKVTRGARQHYVTRCAFGITQDRKFDCAWIAHSGGKIYRFADPVTTLVEKGVPSPVVGTDEWKVKEAVGGGPRLIEKGKERITYTEEVFYGSGFPSDANYARCAIGNKKDGTLVLFVTDGYQPDYSTGLTLHQLAQVMLSFGCVEAMNLDGGGSQTLVVKDQVLNRPAEGEERPVTSIWAVLPAAS